MPAADLALHVVRDEADEAADRRVGGRRVGRVVDDHEERLGADRGREVDERVVVRVGVLARLHEGPDRLGLERGELALDRVGGRELGDVDAGGRRAGGARKRQAGDERGQQEGSQGLHAPGKSARSTLDLRGRDRYWRYNGLSWPI